MNRGDDDPSTLLAAVERAREADGLLSRSATLATMRAAMVRRFAALADGPARSEALAKIGELLERERTLHAEAAAALSEARELIVDRAA